MQSYTDAETIIKYRGISKHIADGINYNYNATEHSLSVRLNISSKLTYRIEYSPVNVVKIVAS